MASFNDITKRIAKAIEQFNKNIPSTQRDMLDLILDEVARLDTSNGRIKTTVANMVIVASIKKKLLKLVLNESYITEVKTFIQAFRDVTTLQNEYWRAVEKKFKPRSILKQIRTQAINDTIESLTGAGIGNDVVGGIRNILNTNITSGGSMKDLREQLTQAVTTTKESAGLLDRYAKRVTTDSINQYNATYTNIVSSDLGAEWYAYQGSDIATTRAFCDAMTDLRYFHISEIPRLLRAENLYYTDNQTGKKLPVPIYYATGLPYGMIAGTDASNFFIRRGGYNCGHQIRPVNVRLVPLERQEEVYATPEYKAWKRSSAT